MNWISWREAATLHRRREVAARWRAPCQAWGVLGVGVLAGTLLQVQQARLSDPGLYGAVLFLGLLGLLGVARVQYRAALGPLARLVWMVLLAGAVAWGGAGLRAAQLLQQALAPELEGRDLVLVGQVASLPQAGPWGWRFVLRVETAALQGRPVALPPELLLGWNPLQHPASPTGSDEEGERDLVEGAVGGMDAGDGLIAAEAPVPGQRWRFTVRLKRVHGARNPGGFDHELWLWEQGILATGWVRARTAEQAPRLLAMTPAYPVERLRQRVRAAIVDNLGAASDPGTGAGVVVALVTGDQRSIRRWLLTIKLYAGFPLKSKATW